MTALEVTLTDRARSEIETECAAAMRERVPLETGGAILGRLDGDTLRLERAVVSARNRRPDYVLLDPFRADFFEDGLRPCADWHLHTNLQLVPSDLDRRTSRTRLGVCWEWGQTIWLSLIVAALEPLRQTFRFYATNYAGTFPCTQSVAR